MADTPFDPDFDATEPEGTPETAVEQIAEELEAAGEPSDYADLTGEHDGQPEGVEV